MTFQPNVRYAVFSIRKAKTKDGNSVWTRAGSAWVNRDGSMNLYLDVLPLDGTLHIREDKGPYQLAKESVGRLSTQEPNMAADEVPDRPSSGDFNDDGTFKDKP
jgi:hypothetical protein